MVPIFWYQVFGTGFWCVCHWHYGCLVAGTVHAYHVITLYVQYSTQAPCFTPWSR